MAAAGKADLLIKNARLIDGSGGPSVRGDLAVRGDRILAVGPGLQIEAAQTIDARGKALSPGFIDVHTHDDRAVLVDPLMKCKTSQGCTTVVTGNCGVSLAPLAIDRRPPAPMDLICAEPSGFYERFADYMMALDAEPPAVNVLAQVGHGTLRLGAMRSLERTASADEIKVMRGRLEESLDAGAVGMSTGLFYPPAAAATTDEVIAIGQALMKTSAMHSTHMRDEGEKVLDSLQETFTIGRGMRAPVVVSHHKCSGAAAHGRSVDTLALIDAARATQPVGLDAYPYVAGSTMLNSPRMLQSSKIIVTWSQTRPNFAGRDLDEVAKEMGTDRAGAVERLVPAGGIFFMMDEKDVQRILKYEHTMVGSDGLPHDLHPHPRLWGTFPRVLGHYVRDIGLFTVEEAVRKMTGLPAAQFGLTDRGRLRAGAFADLVLFDPETVADLATFEKPTTPSAGIERVYVNGRAVWQDGRATGTRPGRAVRRQQLGTFGAPMR